MSFRNLEIRFTRRARNNLEDIYLYGLQQWGQSQADEYQNRIMSVIESLSHSPDMGIARNDVMNGLRSFPIGAHIILYRHRAAVLTIHAVVGRRIDVHSQFKK